MKEKQPEAPKMPPSWADPSAWHNWEDAMVRYQDVTSWDTTDYSYPQSGWDTAFPMDEADIDALERYAG